jgi:hypothetical protein
MRVGLGWKRKRGLGMKEERWREGKSLYGPEILACLANLRVAVMVRSA